MPAEKHGSKETVQFLLKTSEDIRIFLNITYPEIPGGFFVQTQRLAIELDHVHNFDCIFRIVFSAKFNKPKPLTPRISCSD